MSETLQTISINNHGIGVKEYNGKRVVTFKDVDECHERPDGTAGRNFRVNKKRFIEGVDYFQRNSSEAKSEFGVIAPNGLTLITESGYLMLVKSFTDDLAWSVQRQLVNSYFRERLIENETVSRREFEKLSYAVLSMAESLKMILQTTEKVESVRPVALKALPLDIVAFRKEVRAAMKRNALTNTHPTTYSELARMVGISRSYLCHIVTTKGENLRAPHEYVMKISKILGGASLSTQELPATSGSVAPYLISVEEAAAQMGINPVTVRQGLIQGLFPFGTAVHGEKSYRYIIIRRRFEAYMSAEDMLTKEMTKS
jgi:hypothetical protein